MPALPTTLFERIKSCADLLEAFFGARLSTVSQDTNFVIGTTVTRIMPQNPRRIAWIMSPVDNNTGGIWVRRDNTVTMANGFNAGIFQGSPITWLQVGDSVIEELWAVGSTAGDAVNLREILLT